MNYKESLDSVVELMVGGIGDRDTVLRKMKKFETVGY